MAVVASPAPTPFVAPAQTPVAPPAPTPVAAAPVAPDTPAEAASPGPSAKKVIPGSVLLAPWDDSKKSYDVQFNAAPFGIKFFADKLVPIVEVVRPEGAGFVCGVIKPGHTVVMVNDRSLLGLTMRDSAKIIAEAADKVKSSQGRVPCTFRFMKTTLGADGQLAPDPAPVPEAAPKKKPGALARCLPKLFGSSRRRKDAQDASPTSATSPTSSS